MWAAAGWRSWVTGGSGDQASAGPARRPCTFARLAVLRPSTYGGCHVICTAVTVKSSARLKAASAGSPTKMVSDGTEPAIAAGNSFPTLRPSSSAAFRMVADQVHAADAWPGAAGGVMVHRRPWSKGPTGEEAVSEHPNVELTRRGYEAFAKGDLAALAELIADDATWHVSGAGPLSGDYHGRGEVFGFFGRLAEETGGTFRLDVHDVLANDEHAVALCTRSASRGNHSLGVPVANVSHMRDGKITEFWGTTADPPPSIDFWVLPDRDS